jgi:hypothetical protein
MPINDTALGAFKKLRERSDGTGAVIRKFRPGKTGADGRELQSARKWFEKCLAEGGIKNFRWHDLRHAFCNPSGRGERPVPSHRILAGTRHGQHHPSLRAPGYAATSYGRRLS